MSENGFWFPPIEVGATVASITVPAGWLDDIRAVDVEQLREPHVDGCDLVLLSVPAGDGLAVECSIRRALRVEGQDA